MSTGIERVSVHDPSVQALLARQRAFWQRGQGDSLLYAVRSLTPPLALPLPQPDGSVILNAERLTPDMIDPVCMIAQFEAWDKARSDPNEVSHHDFLAILGAGDLLPHTGPPAKFPWLEAMLGCPLVLAEGQIWVERYPGDPEEVIQKGAHFEENPWFQLYLEFIRQCQQRLGNRYPVTANTLFRGPSDLVAALLGVDQACLGWVDRPDFMARLMRVCTDANLVTIEAGNRVVERFQDGYMSIYGVWTPELVVRAQADHSSLLSARMYETQVHPFDRELIRACPYCIFHTHNSGLHVAPVLAAVPELSALQVTIDPYPEGKRLEYEIAMLQRAQEYKPLVLDVHAPTLEEAERLLSQLKPQQLYFNVILPQEQVAALPEGTPGTRAWTLA